MPDLTQAFVDYLFEKSGKITGELLEKARACREDTLAVTAAGAAKNRGRWEALLHRMPAGSARLIGYPETVDGRTAALINGFNAHALELDDGQRFAMIHLGASVVSALGAAADEISIREDKLLRGIVMGYEAACRAAIAMQPSHKNRGYHTAGTCGTIGAAVGVAFAMGMNPAQMKRVLTCAAGSAAGMLEMQEQRSELKPYNLGRASMDGLAAAWMGYAEFETPDDILGGERGFFRSFADTFDPRKLVEKTDYYEIERIYVKPYASCRHSHSAVEAAILLHGELDAAEIDHVLVRTYRLGVKGHDHREIPGTAAAKLSTPYAVAAGLLYGRADLTVFDPLDERVLALARKVTVEEAEELTRESPAKRIAAVTVTLLDGSERSRRVDYAKGDPENPMTAAEREEKKRMLKAYTASIQDKQENNHKTAQG